MTAPSSVTAAELRSGKGSGNENFPVASRLVHPRHRAVIMAFSEFVRIADDIADHEKLAPDLKLIRGTLKIGPKPLHTLIEDFSG